MSEMIVVNFHGRFQVMQRTDWRNGMKVAGPGSVEEMRIAAQQKAAEVARKAGKRVVHPSDDVYEVKG